MAKRILLEKLILKNFKGIKDLTIDFSKNTNIYGGNATGKTSIFDAFTWLMFDKDSKDRTTFELKTLSENGEVIHGLEHEVTGAINIDGKDTILTKIYKEKWTKKRGESERNLTGHETLYYINEVPVKKSEYQEAINEIIDEGLFKLISNPLYFGTNMKWQDRRNVLLDIIGDITTENVINYKKDLKNIEQLLEDTDIDSLKKSIQARKRKLNDEIKSIPFRIDECNNSISDLDFDALEFRRRGILSGIKSLEEKILDSSKINEEILKQKNDLYELRSKLQDIEYKAKGEAQKPLKNLNEQLRKLEAEIYATQRNIDITNNRINAGTIEIDEIDKKMIELRERWIVKNKESLTIDEEEFICPTCKRTFDTENIEAKKHEMEENFNENKAKKLVEINKMGKTLKIRLERLKEEIAMNQGQLNELNNKFSELTTNKTDLQKAIDEFNPNVTLETNEEYQTLNKQSEILETKLQQPQEIDSISMDLKNRKYQLQQEVEDINKQLTYKEQNIKLKSRISELMDEENKLAQRIAQLEGQEFLCEEFIKTKVELLESSINSKFKYVNFKLFDTQVNGALNETCEALINGVPFGNANTASQINAGLDIINALSNHYGVQAPIFIDNRESVNELLNTESQVINLIVSKDKSLRIESEVM